MTSRPLVNALTEAFATVLEAISLGATTMLVGRGEAPDCDPPYLVVTTPPGSSFTGPISDPDNDGVSRIQVRAVGTTKEQAELALDKARAAISVSALQAEYAGNGRRVIRAFLDIYQGGITEFRGLPDEQFSEVDQYEVYTTPAPSL